MIDSLLDSLFDSLTLAPTLVFIGIIALLLLVIWSIKRHRSPKLKIECGASIGDLIPSLAGLTLGSAVAGNSVALLENGHFFDELIAATGSKKIGKGERELMEAASCKVVFFHKKSIYNIGVMNERDHRKLVVIDGREAFVGGHCVVDTWLGNAEDGQHYADLSVRLRGPIVHSVQAVFSENWGGQTGELFLGDAVFPGTRPSGRGDDSRGLRQARRLGPGCEDSSPHGDLRRQKAHLDSKPLLHPRA